MQGTIIVWAVVIQPRCIRTYTLASPHGHRHTDTHIQAQKWWGGKRENDTVMRLTENKTMGL